jgi:hypothetical protein
LPGSFSFLEWNTAEREVTDDLPAAAVALPYRIRVQGYVRRNPVLFKIVVCRGDGEWPIRRRFRQIWALHAAIQQELRNTPQYDRLPSQPPRISVRQLVFGQRDSAFLNARVEQLEQYFQALLAVIPSVDQSEALQSFLFRDEDVTDRDVERLMGLSLVLGAAERPSVHQPADKDAVSALPRAKCGSTAMDKQGDAGAAAMQATAEFCVICQDPMNPADEDDDIRVLPCGHHFHFICISHWLQQRNACCICQLEAVPSGDKETGEK